ncbi:MAG: DUF6090 family protein [Bacteroidota bacterium]
MAKESNRIVYLLQEIVIVVIGVLIAVSISNYKERTQNEKYIEKILLAVDNEIKLSKVQVDTILNRHLKTIDYLQNNITEQNKDRPLGELLQSLGGIQSPDIKSISLRFYISNKAELVDFQIISQLSDIEIYKNSLSEKMTRLINFIYEHINDTDEDTKKKLVYYLANVIDSEKALIRMYSNFIDEKSNLLTK